MTHTVRRRFIAGLAASTVAAAVGYVARPEWARAETNGVADLSDEAISAFIGDPSSLTSASLNAAYALIGSSEVLSQRVDEIRRGKGGVVGTNGRAVVALRVDHQLDAFIAKVQPIFKSRALPYGIGIVTRSVGNPSATYEPTVATWADIRSLILNEGGEIWCHSATHSNGSSFHDEIVTSKAEIESRGIKVMGWQQPGGPATYEHHSIASMDDLPGRLIRATYGLYESYMPGTAFRNLPTNGSWGFDHVTIDTMSLTAAKAVVDNAITYGLGVEIMLHPLNFDRPGYTTTANFAAFIDYLVAKQDAGLLEVLTPSGLAFADPGSSRRFQLVPFGTFETVATTPIPAPWAMDSGAAWTIKTDGGHSGSNYLHVPRTQSLATSRMPIGNFGMDGFTFMFEGWCRSTDVGGATWRVSIGNRGAFNAVLANKTGILSQAETWTRVRFPFTCTVQSPSDLTVGIGRVAGGSIDWDDVSVVPV